MFDINRLLETTRTDLVDAVLPQRREILVSPESHANIGSGEVRPNRT
jgi:hypothetical protein